MTAGDPQSNGNLRRTTPARHLAVMAVLMLATAWLAIADRVGRGQIESHMLPTALGDRNWHPVARGGDVDMAMLGLPLAWDHGLPLYLQAKAPRELQLRNMLRVGETDSGGYALYQETGKGDDGGGGARYLMVGLARDLPGRGLFVQVAHERKYRAPDEPAPPTSR